MPYIVFSLYPLYLIKNIIQGQYNVALNRTVEFFYGEYSWFVPSFVISNLVFNGICRMLPKKRNRLLMGIICLFVGILIKDIRLFDFWCIDAALCGVFYMVLGVSIVDQIDYLKTLHIGWIGAGICAYGVIIVACISLYIELPRYDFHNVVYCNYFLCLAATLIGCVVLIAIFSRIKEENKLTMLCGMVGRNTLVIFITHFLIKKYLSCIFASIVPYNEDVFLSALFYSILSCLAGAIIGELTKKKLPILYGRMKIHTLRRDQ